VTEVSKELQCSKNTAFHALDTLLHEGYLVRDVGGTRYQLSHLALSLARPLDSVDLRSLSMPYLQRIHLLTSESVFLSVLVGRQNVCIDSIQTRGVTVGYSPLSQPLPLHAGTGSRLLLAYLNDEEIEEYLKLESPLRKFTPTTITEPESIREEVKLIRRVGFARGYEDFSTGATYLAFPVVSSTGRPLAAVTIGGPRFRFTSEIADAFIPEIRVIMSELNQHCRMMSVVPVLGFG
jgi:IclR family transcriptional regulator, KDG regulon repressor